MDLDKETAATFNQFIDPARRFHTTSVESGGSDNAEGIHNDTEHPDSPAMLAGDATAQAVARQWTTAIASPSPS